MGLSVLNLIKAACYELNIPAPSAIAASTDSADLQLKNLFYAIGEDLRRHCLWPQLKKRYTVRLESGRSQYQLPQDFYQALYGTHWDNNNQWRMLGPLSDSSFSMRTYGYVTIENRNSYRVFGPDFNPNSGQGQFNVDPTPGDDVADTELSFEYVSRNWLMPAAWSASTGYSGSDQVSSAGNIYTRSSGTTSGAIPPNMAYGVGQDGGVFWLYIAPTSWGADTAYAAGDYVTNGGNLYLCTVGGVSASSGGPTGTTTNTDITDNTVTWQYKTVGTWTGSTSYDRGDIILESAKYYKSVTPVNNGSSSSKTGKNAPTWSNTTVSDGGVTWTFRSSSYETIGADTDICVFDDELMKEGLKFKFALARGLEFQSYQQQYERMKSVAATRWNAGKVISMGGSDPVPSGLNPNIPEGRFTL